MNHDELLCLLADVTGSAEVPKNPQLKLYDTQMLDSMRTVELFLVLDERCGINISPAESDRETRATPEKFILGVEARAAAA